MKKMLVWFMSLILLLSALGACAEGEAPTFKDLAGLEWSFSSGAGAWSTELYIAEDGSFTGNYHDSEMGEAADDYQNGTVYYSTFSGQMSLTEQADDAAWAVRIDSLTLQDAPGNEYIDEGIRFVATDPYGISEGDEMLLYLPGTPVEVLTEDMKIWAHLLGDDIPTTLPDWFLYSARNESGFVGYAIEEDVEIANPWTDMTREELEQCDWHRAILWNAGRSAIEQHPLEHRRAGRAQQRHRLLRGAVRHCGAACGHHGHVRQRQHTGGRGRDLLQRSGRHRLRRSHEAHLQAAGREGGTGGIAMDGIHSILIKDTTREERIRIVNRSLAVCGTECEFCSGCDNRGGGRIETYYQPYIDGEKELRQLNEEFRAGLVRG